MESNREQIIKKMTDIESEINRLSDELNSLSKDVCNPELFTPEEALNKLCLAINEEQLYNNCRCLDYVELYNKVLSGMVNTSIIEIDVKDLNKYKLQYVHDAIIDLGYYETLRHAYEKKPTKLTPFRERKEKITLHITIQDNIIKGHYVMDNTIIDNKRLLELIKEQNEDLLKLEKIVDRIKKG